MPEDDNRKIAFRYFDEILTAGRLDVIDQLMTPDFVFTIPTQPDPFHGPAGFKQLVAMLHGAFPDLQFTVEHLCVDGDTVVGHWTASGTHTGEPLITAIGPVSASGRPFRIDGITWLTIVDNKIVESLANEDTLGLLRQLGALPAEAPSPSTTRDEAMELMRRYFEELLNCGRFEVMPEIMSNDVVLRIPTLPDPVRGLDGIRGFVTGLRNAFPDIRFDVERRAVDGDRAAARWSLSGTQEGTFLGIAPTGRHVKDGGVDLFVLRSAKIREIWINENDFGLLQQLGAIPMGDTGVALRALVTV